MKILHINEYYCHFGGTEKYLFDICKALTNIGHDILIISSSEKESIHIPGIQEYFIKGSYGLRSSLKVYALFKKLLRKENPDVIHLHNIQYFLGPFILKYLIKVKPIVMTVHDVRMLCPTPVLKAIPATNKMCEFPLGQQCFKNGCYPFFHDRKFFLWNLYKFLLMACNLKILKNIDRMIAPSSYMREQLIINGFPKEIITVIPEYIEKSSISEEKAKEKNLKTILYVGRLDASKGILQFIEGLGFLKHQKWSAEIVGDGEIRKEAHEFVNKLGLNGRIKFVGRLSTEELNSHYSSCSFVVMPSIIPESFGLVGIEAMAFGKPVVAFDSGGIREWLVDGETGFLVKRGDIRMLAERISQLLGDDQLARNMGLKGKERVEKYYRRETHLEKLLAIYEEAVNNRKKKG